MYRGPAVRYPIFLESDNAAELRGSEGGSVLGAVIVYKDATKILELMQCDNAL